MIVAESCFFEKKSFGFKSKNKTMAYERTISQMHYRKEPQRMVKGARSKPSQAVVKRCQPTKRKIAPTKKTKVRIIEVTEEEVEEEVPRRRTACGWCAGCRRKDCEKCDHCRAMIKYGGDGMLRRKCRKRVCKNMEEREVYDI